MAFITIDVTGRAALDSPLPGSVEISTTLMVFIIFLALASTEATSQHIRLTAISDRLGPNKVKYLNILAYVLGIVLTGIIVYLAWPWAWESWVNQDYIEGMLRVPYYPAKFVAAIGLTFLLLQFGLKLANQVVKKEGSSR